ncbi:hypothetical protein CFOL_v3_33840 [Cephalotus follicularis]|uniref:DUF761 domain-containing protein n=1 Tax=Cephalotus follicularis TaxID=3775 RepID=A0A1Q3DDA3_CEPFO|nr:hypothetical protein CFOL_v3_33840 [Cephalotus follicularis]
MNSSSSTSISQHHIEFSYSRPLLLFSLLNTIVLVIMIGSYRPSAYQVDMGLPCFQFPYEEMGHHQDTAVHDRDDNDYEGYGGGGSNGYYEDDDHSGGSDEEIVWKDEEEVQHEDDLEKRIEDFILMVNNRWREERMKEKLTHQFFE